MVALNVLLRLRTLPVPPVDVEEKPGGSGTFAFLGLVIGGELRSMTHCGGGGVVERLLDDIKLEVSTARAIDRNANDCVVNSIMAGLVRCSRSDIIPDIRSY